MNDPLEPSALVIFGITGDLAKRKVLPALYHLFQDQLVHEQTYLVGTSRRQVATDEILGHIRDAVTKSDGSVDQAVMDRLASHFSMLEINPVNEADYDKLREHLSQLEETAGTHLQRLFYLSIPPQVYGGIVERLGTHGLNQGGRLLVEKPFGYDLQSAEELIAATSAHFSEDQIFRIDHYLAKETAQNILIFRCNNPMFNRIWNNQNIRRVSITAAESIGIEGRANFYDHTGALRDLIQSHLMQLLSLTLMDIPETITSENVHANKQAVLQNILPIPADQVAVRTVRGQYQTYRDEVENPDSTTETFASMVLYSQDERWAGIPLRLTTGKALKVKRTSITVDFGEGAVNRLQFRIQPDEGITLKLQVKKPGFTDEIEPTHMDFTYESAFTGVGNPDAYERVLVEAIRGDHLLFATDQEVLAAWHILQPVLNEWNKQATELMIYESGSDGPDVSGLTSL
jgi:glucose-6-phosphate 1-dehydrogenase